MITSFEDLSSEARVWVYQADRALTTSEQQQIGFKVENFLQKWAAHGQALYASVKVVHDHFLIIAADERFQMASGCSIDSSVHFVQELGLQLNIDFFNRNLVAVKKDQDISLIPLQTIKTAIADGKLELDTLIFQNNVSTLAALDSSWCVAAGESWLKRYFKAPERV